MVRFPNRANFRVLSQQARYLREMNERDEAGSARDDTAAANIATMTNTLLPDVVTAVESLDTTIQPNAAGTGIIATAA
jgi:hypothetical protein